MIPAYEQIAAIAPFEMLTVNASEIDERGHMNIRHYFDAASRCALSTCRVVGLDAQYRLATDCDVFTAEQHLHYYQELRGGETYSTRVRVVGRSDKALSLVVYVVDETGRRLAATFEVTFVNVNLSSRRPASISRGAAEMIDRAVSHSDAFGWQVELHGRLAGGIA